MKPGPKPKKRKKKPRQKLTSLPHEEHELRSGAGRLTFARNQRGVILVNGKSLRTPTTDSNTKPGTRDREDEILLEYACPLLDTAVREINRETQVLRLLGKLKPFREGEPIGVLPRRVKQKPPTEKQVRAFNHKMFEWRRESMLALRAKNDLIIRELLAL